MLLYPFPNSEQPPLPWNPLTPPRKTSLEMIFGGKKSMYPFTCQSMFQHVMNFSGTKLACGIRCQMCGSSPLRYKIMVQTLQDPCTGGLGTKPPDCTPLFNSVAPNLRRNPALCPTPLGMQR
uniref:Uncharacterized protein n=1 Tax=Molossus molossus TaxID=27622 RepID=A0A7J8C8W8_MOLMO|nr:hypothetical protein HJG59_009936 [Molossus molossus]